MVMLVVFFLEARDGVRGPGVEFGFGFSNPCIVCIV